MYSINASKTYILNLFDPAINLDEMGESDLLSRIYSLQEQFFCYPRLKTDSDIFARLMTVTKKSADPTINLFIKNLYLDHYFPRPNRNKFLSLTKEILELVTAEFFWKYVEDEGIERFTISYHLFGKGFVKILKELKPPLKELYEEVPLLFDVEEGNLYYTKAQLLCCGNFFKIFFDQSLMNEVVLKDISIKGFLEIIDAVGNEEYDFTDHSVEFHQAAEYLGFSPEIEVPEKFHSAKERVEKLLGDIGEVSYPKGFFEALMAPCPFSEDAEVKTIDTHVIAWVPSQMNGQHPSAERLREIIKDKSYAFMANTTKLKGGYWVIMCKKTFDFPQHILKKNHPDYEIPNLLDFVLCGILHHQETSEFLLSNTYLWCKESGKTYHGQYQTAVNFKNFVFDSLQHYYSFNEQKVAICPIRKFYAK